MNQQVDKTFMRDELTVPDEINAKISFLEGGGSMGELIRNFDWKKTPLGVPETWPQSLRTCVRIMLTSRQPIWIGWGKDLIKLYNDPYKTIVGGKHPKALGQPASVVWKDIWEDIEPMLKTVMEKDEGTYVESQLLIMERNGYPEETYYTFSYTPIPGDNGGTAGMICANTDDTERIINERQLRTLKDLGKNLAKKHSVTEVYKNALKVLENNLKDFPFAVLYKIDNEGRAAAPIAYANMEGDKTILPSEINILKPKEGILNFCKAFNTKEIVVSENNGRRKNLPKGFWEIEPTHFIHVPIITSGSTHPNAILTAALNPYRIFDDNYRQFITLVADQIALEVNNVMAYEEERKRAEALAEIDKAKTVFFSNISHEFRTPLTLMLGPLEDLLNHTQTQLTADEKNKIETTHRNAIRLLRLVNNLLDFSRIEAGRAKAQYQLTDISAFTKDLAGSFRSAIENAGLTLYVNCEYIVQPVYVDRDMWEKIVLNLLSNAFKYTLDGSITVSVTVKNDNAELRVTDTGVGIPKEELPKLFQRFYRVQNVTGRTYEGTGIGLSLVNELVKLHGGNISVSSEVGKGSEFTVSIPTGKNHLPTGLVNEIKVDTESRLTDSFLEETRSLIETSLSIGEETFEKVDGTSVLVVDDNPDMREYLKTILSKKFNVSTAVNGIDALQKIKQQPPELILSDVMMPVMDGIQLLKTIKAEDKWKKIPIVLLSARAGEESKIEGYEIGADDYLTKPFSSKELLARISAQLSVRKKIEENEKQLQYFIRQAPVGIVVYKGADFIVELANERVLEMWGKKLDEVQGRSMKDIFPEIATDGYIQNLYKETVEHFLQGQTFIVTEAELTFKRNGELYTGWYNYSHEPLKDADGNVTGIIAVANEVTDQVLARKKVDESEALFRTLATEFPLFVWLTDEKLQTTFLNRTGLEYFGLDEMIKMSEVTWKEFIHPDDIERVLGVMHESAKKQEPYTLTMRMKNGKTDEYRWFLDRGLPRFDNKRFIGFIGTSLDIHEQKVAEEAIARSEEKYRHLSATLEQQVNERTAELVSAQNFLQNKNKELVQAQQIAQLGNWEWDPSVNEITWSEQMYHIYGYGEERFPVNIEKATERMSPQDAEKITGRMRKNIAQAKELFKEKGQTEHDNAPFEYSVLLPDGSEKILQGAGKLILDNNGEILKVIGTVQDITSRKKSENKIKTINKQLNEAQQIARLGSWEWNVVKNELSWSQNMFNIYEVNSEDGINYEKFISLVHPDDRRHMEELIASSIKNKRFEDFYHRIITPAGNMKILHGRGELIFNKEGQVVKMVGTAQDVTIEKMMEDKLIETNETLEQRNKFVEKLINSSLDVVIVVDSELRFITVNKKAESLISSYYPHELIGKKITEINPILEDSETYSDILKAFRGDIVIRDKVKSIISENYYEHNYIPLQHASGEVYAVMIISHDITENIRQIEELKKLNEADKLKSDFIKMASHELKTPVTSIKGYVQLLLTALKEEKNLSPLLVKSSLISIDKQITRLTRLMSELLDLSKIETGALVLNKEIFSLNELVIETVQDILYTNSKHTINIFHDFEANVFGDKDRIGQVLINFLTNAIKYSPNSDKVEVWVKQKEKETVSVSVIDFGIGIDKEYHEKIFERFYRASGKEEQTYPGFGIGLFIAKEIVQRHNGTILLDSKKGKGSVFTFTLAVSNKNNNDE